MTVESSEPIGVFRRYVHYLIGSTSREIMAQDGDVHLSRGDIKACRRQWLGGKKPAVARSTDTSRDKGSDIPCNDQSACTSLAIPSSERVCKV